MSCDVGDRPSIEMLLEYTWIKGSRGDLEELYERVVIQGKNWKAD
jgi:hypothetical protein